MKVFLPLNRSAPRPSGEDRALALLLPANLRYICARQSRFRANQKLLLCIRTLGCAFHNFCHLLTPLSREETYVRTVF